MHITLEQLKQHLVIDQDVTIDDQYLTGLIEVAEDAVAKHLNVKSLDELVEEGSETVPATVRQSILLLCGNLYNNREPVAFTGSSEIPYTFGFLQALDHNYDYKNGRTGNVKDPETQPYF